MTGLYFVPSACTEKNFTSNCPGTADAFAGAAGDAGNTDNFQFYCSFLLFPGTNEE